MRNATPPEWWRGQKPSDYAFGVTPFPGDTLVSGRARAIDFASPPPSRTSGLRVLIFDRASVEHVDIPLDWTRLVSMWSEFDSCQFTQSTTSLDYSGAATQGSFGNRPSLYRDCRFSRVRFGSPGRFDFGQARFENCHFDRCRFNGSFAHDADFVDCTFVGRIDGMVWAGRSPTTGRQNAFSGNDFTAAQFTDNVGFRAGITIAGNRWPDGYLPVDR